MRHNVCALAGFTELTQVVDRLAVRDLRMCRYLRARKFNIDKATHMLKGTLAWRKSFRPHEIDPASVAFESSTGKVYPNGHDRTGRPILILCPGRENSKDSAAQCTPATKSPGGACPCAPLKRPPRASVRDRRDQSATLST